MATVAQTLRFDGGLGKQLLARAPVWAIYVLVILIGLRAALLLADLAGPPAAAPVSVEALPPPVTRNVVDLPSILRANLFGQGAPVTGAAAPITSMALKLAGVVAIANDEKQGYAMLGPSASDIKFYKVGDTIPGGARLHGVLMDRVLLDRGGSIEALLLPVRTSASTAPPPLPVVANPAASVQRVQQVIRERPGIIGQVIQRQAYMSDGKLRGMRVYPGPNGQAFNRLGLRPGDLVTAINGVSLQDQTRSEEIFASLNGAPEARVTVERNGVAQDLVLNLAEIAAEAERLAQAPPPEADTGEQQPPPDSAR